MKFRIKISGWAGGSRTSFTKTVECPDFVDHTFAFDDDRYGPLKGYSIPISVLEQQNDWVDAHYDEIVIDECERRFIHPIDGFAIVKSNPVSKKQQVIDLLSQVCEGKDEQYKAMVIGTLSEMWSRLKHSTPESICASVLTSVNATIKITAGVLMGLSDRVDEYRNQSRERRPVISDEIEDDLQSSIGHN